MAQGSDGDFHCSSGVPVDSGAPGSGAVSFVAGLLSPGGSALLPTRPRAERAGGFDRGCLSRVGCSVAMSLGTCFFFFPTSVLPRASERRSHEGTSATPLPGSRSSWFHCSGDLCSAYDGHMLSFVCWTPCEACNVYNVHLNSFLNSNVGRETTSQSIMS